MTLPDPRKRPSIRRPLVRRSSNKYVGPIIFVSLLALVLQMAWMRDNFGQLARRTDRVPFDPDLVDRLSQRLIVQYECEYCLGSGLRSDPDRPGERVLCAICRGVGYHSARRYYEDDRMCLNCGGMGRTYDEAGIADFCSLCDGRGMVSIEGALDRDDQ